MFFMSGRTFPPSQFMVFYKYIIPIFPKWDGSRLNEAADFQLLINHRDISELNAGNLVASLLVFNTI